MATLYAVEPLFDRKEELAFVLAVLGDEKIRLLTIVGPAGVGKTQMALHAAAALRDVYPEQGIISLAPCRDIANLVTTIARTIGLRERGTRPLRERLTTALHDRRMLLLLDNVEQALPAAAALAAELIAACPRLTLLVTSRAPLNIHAEQIFTVRPLRLPDAGHPVTLATAANTPAVQMFVHRASTAAPGFAMTEANAAKVIAICRHLDGLPLAIELAAPRTRVMTLDQLLRQIDQRFTLLTSGARDLPHRQQSLRANIAWSVELLTPDQQALFRRLAVFAEGFTLEAAVAVMGHKAVPPSSEMSWSATDVANGIALLLEQNLLTRREQTHGPPRFGMLETIREYAREQLTATGEVLPLRERHLRWVSDLAERADTALFGFEQEPWLLQLDAEWENARAALTWAIESQNSLGALQLSAALTDFWYLRGMLSEGAQFLGQALRLSEVPAGHDLRRARVRTLSAASQIAQPRGDLEGARSFAQAGLDLASEIGDHQGQARALALLGNHALVQDDLERAAALHRAALLRLRELDGNHRWIVAGLNNLGQIAYQQCDYQEALTLASEALVCATSSGDAWGVALAHQRIGDAALALSQINRAADHFVQSLIQNRDQLLDWGVANAVASCASLATAAGMPERGIRLFAAASSLYQSMGVSIPPKLRPDWATMLDRARASTDSGRSAHAWVNGSQLKAEDAIAEALAVAVQVARKDTASPKSPGLAQGFQRPQTNRRVRKRGTQPIRS